MNKERLQTVIDRMKAIAPDQYNQGTVTHYDGEWCGTAACVAGHAYACMRGNSIGARGLDSKAHRIALRHRLEQFQGTIIIYAKPNGDLAHDLFV